MAKGRKTGGRRAGTPNRGSMQVDARCRAMIEDPAYQATFQARLHSGKLPPPLEALAWHYAYGKPHERMEVTGLGGGPLVVRWKS